MTTTWKYDKFSVYSTYGDFTDVVYGYYYVVEVTDGTTSSIQTGTVRLNFGIITNPVPFSQLTQEIVQQWTEACMDTAAMVQNLTEAVIAKSAETRTDLPAPWEPVVPATPVTAPVVPATPVTAPVVPATPVT